MGELYPSLHETKKMIERLQKNKSEDPTVDAKETLNLKEDGDCASFIRHIAALANIGLKSYLLIGVENGTWDKKGIPADSPLLKIDSTQQQMNQILNKRLDPRVQVGYQVYKIDGMAIGVVGLEGQKPPYVVSIDDTRYGGSKTKGEGSYIYKGVIYMRQGTESVPVSRQSEIIEILNGRRNYIELIISVVFISVVVSVAVGVGASLIRYRDPYTASILGGIWGVLIGWFMNKRLADAFGKFSAGWLDKFIKTLGGSFCGGIVGAFLAYMIVENILSGKLKINDPISMGFVIAPLFAIILVFFIVLSIIPWIFSSRDIFGFLVKRSKR